MPSKFTPSLRLELQANGENDTTWGDIANKNFENIEAAIAGRAVITMPNADYTLSTAFGAADDARNMLLQIQGTLTTGRNVIVPAQNKMYVVRNITAGGFSVTVRTATGSGVTVANGETRMVICDGTNVFATGAGNDVKVSSTGISTSAESWTFKGFLGVNRTNAVDPNYGVVAIDGNQGSYFALYANGVLIGTITATAAGLTLNAGSTPLNLATGGAARMSVAPNGVVTFANDIATSTNVRGQQGIFEQDVFGRSMTITNGAPTIYMVDSDGADRNIVLNGGFIGFALSNGNWGVYNDDSGNTVSTGNVTAYSDERKKTDWDENLPDFVRNLAGVKCGTYTDIDSGERRAGVSAQDMQGVLKETVMETRDGFLAVAYGNAALVSAIQLAREVEDLKERLAKLEAK